MRKSIERDIERLEADIYKRLIERIKKKREETRLRYRYVLSKDDN